MCKTTSPHQHPCSWASLMPVGSPGPCGGSDPETLLPLPPQPQPGPPPVTATFSSPGLWCCPSALPCADIQEHTGVPGRPPGWLRHSLLGDVSPHTDTHSGFLFCPHSLSVHLFRILFPGWPDSFLNDKACRQLRPAPAPWHV